MKKPVLFLFCDKIIRKSALFFIFFTFANLVFSQRVVSMAPAITEIVFALGKGSSLVGVTKFCDYPSAALKIAKVGGFLDVNLEVLLALAPDIVIAYPEHQSQLKLLESRASLLVVGHRTLSDLYASIAAIGSILNAELAANEMVLDMKNKLAAVAAKTGGGKKSRVLIIAGRNADELKNMHIVGKKDFLNELVEIAGGVNAYQGEVNYPNISLETVLFLNPDFIIEISAFYEGIRDEKIFALWRPFAMLQAVQNKRIIIIKESFWLRPGSRVVRIATALAGIIATAKRQENNVSTD